MKNQKITLPDDDLLLSQKEDLSLGITNALNSHKKTNKTTVRDKLRLLNNELIRFKGSGISYKIIKGVLLERLNLKVSEQTLREHCQQDLGFEKRSTKNVNKQSTKQEPRYVTTQDKLEPVTPYKPHENTQFLSKKLTEQTQLLINNLEDF